MFFLIVFHLDGGSQVHSPRTRVSPELFDEVHSSYLFSLLDGVPLSITVLGRDYFTLVISVDALALEGRDSQDADLWG